MFFRFFLRKSNRQVSKRITASEKQVKGGCLIGLHTSQPELLQREQEIDTSSAFEGVVDSALELCLSPEDGLCPDASIHPQTSGANSSLHAPKPITEPLRSIDLLNNPTIVTGAGFLILNRCCHTYYKGDC